MAGECCLLRCWLVVCFWTLASLCATTRVVASNTCSRDLWTNTTTGCVCYFNVSRTDCACCHPGGCQCGPSDHHQCVKCADDEDCGRGLRAAVVVLSLLLVLSTTAIVVLVVKGRNSLSTPTVQTTATAEHNYQPLQRSAAMKGHVTPSNYEYVTAEQIAAR